MSIGLTIMLLSVSAGIHFGDGGFALLICFTGVLAGANLVAVGVRMADHLVPTFPAVFGGARALAAFVRRNTAAVGLFMASCAVTMLVAGEAHPVLCFATFVLLLLGVFLINNSTSELVVNNQFSSCLLRCNDDRLIPKTTAFLEP